MQSAAKVIASNDIYPGKIFHTDIDYMAQINMTYEDMMRAAKGMQNQYQQQNLLSQNQMSQGLQGLGSGYGQLGGQLPPHLLQQVVNNPSPPQIHYPGIREAFGFLRDGVKETAELLGFKYNHACDSFQHKDGGFVTRRMIEDCGTSIKDLFIRAKSPNIHWLDDRIEEIRFKL